MFVRLAVAATLIGTLAGCAYPGHEGLLRDAHQVKYVYAGDRQVLADCLTDKFNNEPFGFMEISTPIATSIQKASSIQLVGNLSTVWAWSLELMTVQKETVIHADVRKSVNPYLSNNYMLDKVGGYLKECQATPADL